MVLVPSTASRSTTTASESTTNGHYGIQVTLLWPTLTILGLDVPAAVGLDVPAAVGLDVPAAVGLGKGGSRCSEEPW